MEEMPPRGELHAVDLRGKAQNDLALGQPPGTLSRRHPIMVNCGIEPAIISALWGADDDEGPVPDDPFADTGPVSRLEYVIGFAILVFLQIEGGPWDQLHARDPAAELLKLFCDPRRAIQLHHRAGGRDVRDAIEGVECQKVCRFSLKSGRHPFDESLEGLVPRTGIGVDHVIVAGVLLHGLGCVWN